MRCCTRICRPLAASVSKRTDFARNACPNQTRSVETGDLFLGCLRCTQAPGGTDVPVQVTQPWGYGHGKLGK
ncbi:hypothetical protein HBI56_021560 [Parastagonospora nodorum]|uniref:Uncharacterized protein n=1 Tax=Phaeosphaeria nodorum (strain SN15 / ATCC MYA-4574 / FGSC 10173) TaxID=321614 RepID=A0A7U2I1I7_PHANO|nr:hypothetical protein HBH56_174530 [Parastagonospora nodorum]QRC96346.1 hypothetical protein JI435_408770 [Parastagonospora nodorum SN15]KAH3926388.1 hypothetical protein HBH54_168620 [Parastagonospora nodorum]KAH3955643.1 hypothetical protein HBH53_001430 [Parastagonospora nodorum]KAH3965593.1 hypothetical protein HBH52_205280 [Parastagonospora nodorum]